MNPKAKYCSQCRAEVTTQVIDDRPRAVCPECGTIFYENPLPVAAGVVLNEKREVLLVKRLRQPSKGEWCLPIGFAETHETIGEAAKRELEEETGVEAEVVRLLDADSYESDFYGELLIVTFELERTGGEVQAGDDAEAVAYYPLADVPPLAFSSNHKALQRCLEVHRDEWAIQDSFESLQSEQGRQMLSDALVAFVWDNAEDVTRMWIDEVRSNPTTTSYLKLDPKQLYDRGFTVVTQFGRWLKGEQSEEQMKAFCRAVGQERRAQGIALTELISSLSLLRKNLWTFARAQGVWQRPIEVYRVLELNRRTAVFFDKALYHAARGYEDGTPP
ncbi:MAG: NUDIX hydrolase [Phycisphaerae bacterium]